MTAHSTFLILRSSFFTFVCLALASRSLGQEASAKNLGRLADEIHLVGGKTLRVVPLATFPDPSSKDAVVECALLEKPDETLAIQARSIQSIKFFEAQALKTIDDSLGKPGPTQLQAADQLLQELGRVHLSRRSHPPLAANPWAALNSQIADKLRDVRRQRLASFAEAPADAPAWAEALRLADAWLSIDASLRDAARGLWLRYGAVKLAAGDLTQARAALDRLDEHFFASAEAEPLRLALRARAATLAKEARDLPAADAIAKLEEALALWLQAPGWRDQLAKLQQTYQVLYVAVRHLPENLSPATAWTNAEQQALELLFSRLVQVRRDDHLGQRYEADLATELPRADGTRQHVELRRDAYWSDGDRLGPADIRHSAQLHEPTSAWRDLMAMPRFEGRPFGLQFTSRQGLLDPLAPLRFYIVPQKFHGRTLGRADDPDFARAPVGSGPFVYAGRKQEGKRTVAVFQADPCFRRGDERLRGAVREIRMMAWADLAVEGPRPHLVLDVPPRGLETLKKLGYADIRSVPRQRVFFLAVNHRVPSLANEDLRRALAHAIPREKLLQEHFRAPGVNAKMFQTLGGVFPAGCWASCPPPRVPDDPYQPELAKSFAKKAGKQIGQARLGLKFPADDPGVKEACAALALLLNKLCAQVQLDVTIHLIPLGDQQMRSALRDHDFELAYHHWDYPDDNFSIAPLFDVRGDALGPGGSNFLGYENDAELQRLLRSALSHRHFPTVRDFFQSIHAHLYERMPLIPLWQLPDVVAVHPTLSVANLDRERLFANVLAWRVNP